MPPATLASFQFLKPPLAIFRVVVKPCAKGHVGSTDIIDFCVRELLERIRIKTLTLVFVIYMNYLVEVQLF